MAKIIAVTDAIKSLADVESRLNLQRNEDDRFFPEWQTDLPELNPSEAASIEIMCRRLRYHRADGELLEGAVMLLVTSPLLELAGLYNPPFKMKAEAAVEIAIDDGEETLRGRIDVLILQNQLWVMVLETKKTTISTRSALPQALAYMMSNANPNPTTFGILTNGDDVIFVKLDRGEVTQYNLSRAFSIYTTSSELRSVLQILKHLSTIL
jgi:hypothetical protein